MTSPPSPVRPAPVGAIDPFVKAFEAAWDVTGHASIESFLAFM